MISLLVEVHSCSIILSSVPEEPSRKTLYIFCGSQMSSLQIPESLPLEAEFTLGMFPSIIKIIDICF